ncbi:MBOAT family O-acyltransferase [Butyrivibrio sp. INlla21]|uniref:MBOAT family O-acyltransferase n=1 Tax=Butyrivibrio sp. INlla21 TaxID=1520811 RepID=UPI0015A50AE7|nr:MBOAT family O-acyltransferase [Butyrivibrio sp. INlla21]
MPIFILGFCLLRRALSDSNSKELALNIWIIAGSLVFYGLFGLRNLAILVASILWNAAIVRGLAVKKDCGAAGPAKIILAIGILADVLLLLVFKFSGLILPIAISFYIFNQISFIVDVYRGEAVLGCNAADGAGVQDSSAGGGAARGGFFGRDFLTYLSYILFFPKILQGPLMSYKDFVAEQKKSFVAKVDWENVMRAMLLLSMGLFKKVILADTFGKAVNYGFSNIAVLGRLEAILSAFFYSFQLYFDFSGYCDVATAVCMLMGFGLVVNFNSPYKSVNIMDFWKRWHITLTDFFTKYIYIPLGGNRKGAVRTYVNILIVFLVSGIWHGTGWTFIVWGLMHGVMSVITRAVKKAPKTRIGHAAAVLANFLYVTAAWVFFRAESVKDAIGIFGRMIFGGIRPFYSTFADGFNLDEIWYFIKVTPLMKLSFAWDICLWLFTAFAVIIIFFCPNAIEYTRKCKIGIRTTLLTAFLLLWCVLSFGGVATYLYMNF